MTDLPRGYRLPSQMEKDFEEWLETALPTVANSGTELEHEIAWAAWQAALASERAKQAEPVALQYRERMGCTCHPDDNPPFPCPQKYALSECRADAAQPAVQGEPTEEMIAEAWREAQGKCNHETLRRIYRVFAAPQAVQAEPEAYLCEFFEEDGSARRDLVFDNPEGFRWGDVGEPSPFKVTPLYAAPPAVQAEPVKQHCRYCGVIDGDGHTGDCALALGLVAAPPADAALFQMQEAAKDLTAKLDEAIALLKVTRKRLVHYQISTHEIDAYLARVNK